MSDAESSPLGDREDAESASIVECEECLQPAEAFAVVGNETRLAILEALWGADERPVAFSELRSRVGTPDSAQFNYHLQKLSGQFVQKTGDGYDFRSAGRAVIQAVLSGSLNQDPELEPFPVEGECIDCGAGLLARYEEESLKVTCRDCGRPHGDWEFPPGGLEDRTRAEVMDAFNQRVRHLLCLTADGVCPACNGRTESVVRRDGSLEVLDVTVEHECRRCGYEVATSVGISLLDDAEMVAFYRDHGVDLNARPFWTLEWCISDRHLEVLDDDPWRFRVGVELDDERLEVVLDEDLSVVAAERNDAAA
jgi:DNA-directed RNA polymerase subunit M/transcription elongation factor TFIIS